MPHQRAMTWPVQIMKFVAASAATAAAVSVFLKNGGGKVVAGLPWDDIGGWTKASAVVLIYVGVLLVGIAVLGWASTRGLSLEAVLGTAFCVVVLPLNALAYWGVGDALLSGDPRFEELRLLCRWMTAAVVVIWLTCLVALRSAVRGTQQ